MSLESEAFGEVVKLIRAEKKLSQETLSFESGLDRTYLSFIERGKHSPTIDTIFKISRGFDMPASEILRAVEEYLDR